MSTNPLKRPLYENHSMLSPSGKILCRCSKRKMNWYLKRNLAHYIPETQSFKLLFTPKGEGQKHPFYKQKHKNSCVVCNSTEDLNRHHIVPHCYRKNFPDYIKQFSSFDILPLCTSCHSKYEKEALKLKKKLSVDLLKPVVNNRNTEDYRKRVCIVKLVNALKNHYSKIPINISIEYLNRLSTLLNKPVTMDNLHEIDITVPNDFSDAIRSKEVVDYFLSKNKLEELVLLWRNHFISNLKPRFLPKTWCSDYIPF